MTKCEAAPESPPNYPRGLHLPAYEFDGKQLYIEDGLGARMNGHPLATYGGNDSAVIDGRAFDILFQACGGYS